MNAAAAIDPPQRFRDFLREHWERLPGTVVDANPHNDAPLLFAALCSAGRRFLLGDTGVDFVVWLDGRKIAMSPDFLPVAGDGDLQGYLERLLGRYPETDFTVLLANPHLYESALWERARQWVRHVADEVGMANGGVDTCTFLGCYRRTPFGVHRGQMSVLTLPVIGRKRFVLWPYDYGHSHTELQDALEFSAHTDHAIVAEASRGDLLYWPADFWHIADAPRRPTAAWNIGFWWDRPPLARVLGAIAETSTAAGQAVGNAPVSFDWRPDAGERALGDALDGLRRTVRSGDLTDALAVQWARFASADGFRVVPETMPAQRPQWGPVGTAGNVMLRPLRRRRLCLAANGHIALLERCPDEVRTWLQHLVAGETVQPPQGPDAEDVLGFLAAAGALRTQRPDREGSDREGSVR